jgi:hypothetical protein
MGKRDELYTLSGTIELDDGFFSTGIKPQYLQHYLGEFLKTIPPAARFFFLPDGSFLSDFAGGKHKFH